MHRRALATCSALLCLTGALAPATSAERRFYLGVDLGQGRINRDFPQLSRGPGSNRESPGWKLRFGYQFSQYVSLEAAYTDFGDYDGAALLVFPLDRLAAGSLQAPGDFTTSAKGIDFSAAATWPIGETFYLSATGGLMRREVKTHFEPSQVDTPGFRAKDGDLATHWGLGFGFRVGESMDIGLNWVTSRNLEGDFEYVENASDPALLSLGLRFRL